MKKLIQYFKSMDAQHKDRQAAAKAHWNSIGRVRQIACNSVIALVLGIIVIGILTKTIHSSLFLSMTLICILPLISRGRRWPLRFLSGVVANPVLAFPIMLTLMGSFAGLNYDAALRDQVIMREHSEEVARDAAEFLTNYRAGKIKNISQVEDDDFLPNLGANDHIGYKIWSMIFDLMHISAPAGVDTATMVPIADIFYADRIVTYYDNELIKRNVERSRAALETRFGMPLEDIPDAEKAAAAPDYKGIFAMTCMFKNDGKILLASGIPTGYLTDLRKYPAADPFIEVCRSEARKRTGR